MNEELLDPLSPCQYICNGVEPDKEEQRQKQKQKNITAKFVQIAPKIFCKQIEMENYLKNLSVNEVAALESWARDLVKRCMTVWKDKRFPSEKGVWLEMMRQRRLKQIEEQEIEIEN